MASLFPSSPINGDIVEVNGYTYIYDSIKGWIKTSNIKIVSSLPSTTSAIDIIYILTTDNSLNYFTSTWNKITSSNQILIDSTQPSDTSKLWLDITDNTNPILKYYNGSSYVSSRVAIIDDSSTLGEINKVFSANKSLVLTNNLSSKIGDIDSLNTTNKSSTVVAINEVLDKVVTSNTANNVFFDNSTTGMSATNVQSAVDMLFSYAYNGKSAIATVIGSPSTINETFAQLSSDIQSNKNILANTLTDRGIETATSETLSAMIAKVAQVSSSSNISKTILNVTAPYTKVFTFTNPINIINLCESVIMYVQGETGVNQYTCDFNNGDSTNFNVGDNVSFDGTMSLGKKVLTGSCISNGVLGTGVEWLSFNIDKTIFNTLDELIYIDSDTTPTFRVNGTNHPSITLANGDINLTGINKITGITWNTTTTNLGVSLLVMSFDSGVTWYGYNGTVWNIVNVNDLSDVKAKGMNKTIVSALTSVELEAMRNNGVTLRFGYYLENGNYIDVANNDSINVIVEMIGENIIAPSSNYTVVLASDGSTLTYNFSVSGSYTLNIVDNLG